MFQTLVAAVMLLVACTCSAFEIGGQVGAMNSEGFVTRGDVSWEVKSWLDIEAGLLTSRNGAIVDVTPMLHTNGRLFVHAGIGLAYNAINNSTQSQGLIFRDVIGVGYKVTDAITITLDAFHYSNGGKLNPVFGSDNNQGYSGGFLGAAWKF